VGVSAGGDRVNADVVVLAEGVNRLLCEKMKVVPPLSADQVALGVRQVVRLGSDKINERFGLTGDEGLAWFFLGKPSDYLPGGAFLYTNSSTVSIGLVLYLKQGIQMPDDQVYGLLEKFRTSPPLGQLLAGGSLVEYGSHLIPEAGLKMMPDKLYGDGYVIVGDAAGLVLNLGYTVRGVDFAVHSGFLAAQAITDAHSSKNLGAANLATYEEKLNRSFVVKEMRRHSAIQKMMQKRHIFEAYPRILVDAARRLYEFDEVSPKLLEAGRRSMKGRRSTIGVLSDLLSLARGP
jgi:electron transfer flavoprotein-quinone oxidoreductase